MDEAPVNQEVVSCESEELILVDRDDVVSGHASKAACHDGEGLLHRAFSLFIFNDEGELLMQQRSAQKRLWPLYWSNSCCSHPRRGETMRVAVHRRLEQELGICARLRFLYKFAYHAEYEELGSERELCWVYVGTSSDQVHANDNEIAAWRFVDPDELEVEIAHQPQRFTPWLRLEWQRLRRDFSDELAALQADPEPIVSPLGT